MNVPNILGQNRQPQSLLERERMEFSVSANKAASSSRTTAIVQPKFPN